MKTFRIAPAPAALNLCLDAPNSKSSVACHRPDATSFAKLFLQGSLFCFLTLATLLVRADPQEQRSAGPVTNADEMATFSGGCFWCMDAVFERVPGVKSVTSGFSGGTVANPTYEQVCTGTTGHVETTQIEFNPAKVSYDRLLDIFWQAHDPTTLNRQGADEGTQYRSVIFYRDKKQKLLAEKSMLEAQKHFGHPIVTEIVPFKAFYKAEDYHQEYYDNNPDQGYSRMVIAPKLEKLEQEKVIQKAPQTVKTP